MFFSYTYQEVEQNRTFYLQMYDPSHQLTSNRSNRGLTSALRSIKTVLP